MKAAVVALAIALSLSAVHAQSPNWAIQSFDSGTLYDVSFADSLVGWSVGTGGRVFASTDGGRTWAEQIRVTSNNLWGVWAISRMVAVAVGNAGTFLKTTNGGSGWSVQTTSPARGWSKVYFANESVGWLVGESAGQIRKSTNGGTTWVEVGPTLVAGFSALWFLNASRGWAVGNAELWRTIDGNNWTNLNSAGLNNLTSVSFPTDSTGYLLESYYDGNRSLFRSTVYRTTNTGNTWIPVDTLLNTFLQDIRFTSKSEGWLTGWNLVAGTTGLDGGCVYHTTDGGLNWSREVFLNSTNYYSPLWKSSFTDRQHGWTVGGVNPGVGPRVVGRYQASSTSIHIQPTMLPSFFALDQNFPNPFNPSTTVRYGLPQRTAVTLNVFNALGQEVAIVVSGAMEAGYHEAVFDASNLSSGVYFYRLVAGEFVETKKFMILR